MISQAALEEAVLALLCFSDQAPVLALRITNPTLFTTRVNQTLAKTALNYITKFQKAPGMQLEYLLENDLRRGEEGKLLGQSIDFLKKQVVEIQPEFVLTELDNFLDTQAFNAALQEAMDAVEQGDLTRAKEAVYKSATVEPDGGPGIWLDDSKAMFRDLDNTETEFFSSGVRSLDDAGVRPERKAIMLLIAAAKKGKSWWLIEVAKSGIQFGKKVLYITLELSEEKVARRLVQSIFSLTKDEAKQVRTAFFSRGQEGTSIDFRDLARDSVIAKRRDVEKKLRGFRKKQLKIKEFPTGSLTSAQLSMYLDSLEKQEGFVPDIVIIDYADLMSIDAAMLRIDTGRLYRDLRGIAVRRKMVFVTATQGNRDSETAKVVDRKNVAEDWSKIGTVDVVLTYSQTAEEKRLGLARLLVAAARDAADRFLVMVSQAYEMGQFCLDSVVMNAQISEAVKAATGSGDD